MKFQKLNEFISIGTVVKDFAAHVLRLQFWSQKVDSLLLLHSWEKQLVTINSRKNKNFNIEILRFIKSVRTILGLDDKIPLLFNYFGKIWYPGSWLVRGRLFNTETANFSWF